MTTFIKKGREAHLKSEREGLIALSAAIEQYGLQIRTPKILKKEKHELHLNLIDQNTPTYLDWQKAGIAIANLHNVKHNHYGWATDNFIGLGKQTNTISHNWAEFFINYRLLAKTNEINNRAFKCTLTKTIRQKHEPLSALLNNTSPSLLHGDLWQGNILFSKGNIWLIDPAIYFGDSEVDIAMTMMFGGFAPDFYKGYESVRPLSSAFETKREIYNLYHYLNHYLLFGDSYLAGCERGLETIAKL